MTHASPATTDLCDAHPDAVRVLYPEGFRNYGARHAFAGPVSTVRAPDDNSLVRAALEEPGRGRVLVVDGAASPRCALLGDQLATLGAKNGWAGVVVYGYVRDSAVLSGIDLGVQALGTFPRKSAKQGRGERDVTVTIAKVSISPGEWLYADADGIIVSAVELTG